MFSSSKVLLLSIMVFTSIGFAKNAIVIGASSGMGREVTKRLSKEGYTLGLVARRMPLLMSLQKELVGPSYIKQIDVTSSDARAHLGELITEMGGLDLIVISISSYLDNRDSLASDEKECQTTDGWPEKERVLDVDAKGFIAMADVAIAFFKQQHSGHLVGISSTSGLLPSAVSPEYAAAKACISRYMESVRNAVTAYAVYVTDIVPGFVAVEHSPLGEDPDAYWEIPVEKAGEIIMEGIRKKKNVVYVPPKVWLLNLLNYLPNCLFRRYFNWL